MNTMEAIVNRKSVRSYTGEQISEEELQTILKAAYAAPVGRALYETLALTVITNPELLAKIDANCAKFFGDPEMHPLYGAPTLILVSSTIQDPAKVLLPYSNASTVVQNMALAAVELGVGSVHIWGAVMAFDIAPELVEELGLPDGFVPCCSIALGKTDEKYEPREIEAERIRTIFLD